MNTRIPIADMKLTPRHFRILAVCSMEQVIGTSISALVGIVLPMILIIDHNSLSSFLQGVTGASALVGIASGSAIIGRLSDRDGYANLFRLCPILITAGMVIPFIFPYPAVLITGLFIAGLGVGGGYSLDSAYISELMPAKWSTFMVGVAKATCSIGFVLIPLCSFFIIRHFDTPHIWRWLMLLVATLGLITFLLRLHYPDSPRWLMSKGRTADAQQAAQRFFGPDAEVLPPPASKTGTPAGWGEMFKGANLKKVIFSGIPWACEGVGVYGIGVFLPVLVMALGIDHRQAEGMAKIQNSVELTTIINCFMIPGFILGLLIVRKARHTSMLVWGFLFYALGVGIVMAAYLLHWPVWVSILGFITFEVALNAGPHLVTFIIPSEIYTIDERGAGTGIAAMLGKTGAIIGVFLMPVILHSHGMKGVLIFCLAVGLLGALISLIFGPMVLPYRKGNNNIVIK